MSGDAYTLIIYGDGKVTLNGNRVTVNGEGAYASLTIENMEGTFQFFGMTTSKITMKIYGASWTLNRTGDAPATYTPES